MGFRRKARESALQMLFQRDFTNDDPAKIERAYFAAVGKVPDVAREYAERLFEGTVEHLDSIDPMIKTHAENWRLERMARVDRSVLRLAVYELLYQAETPAKVVINEACEIARKFAGDDSVPFVNGVLDGVRRAIEVAPRPV